LGVFYFQKSFIHAGFVTLHKEENSGRKNRRRGRRKSKRGKAEANSSLAGGFKSQQTS